MATESVGPARKKAKQDASLNGNGGINASKKSKSSLSEMESFPTGIGTKSKPCTKFFSPKVTFEHHDDAIVSKPSKLTQESPESTMIAKGLSYVSCTDPYASRS